jgi:hypothetical protein
VLLLLISFSCAVRRGGDAIRTNADPFAQFHQGVGEYMELRQRSEQLLPPLSDRASAAEIVAYVHEFAQLIRAFRDVPEPGCVITQEAAERLRQIAHEELAAGTTLVGNPAYDDEGDDIDVDVNAGYPTGAPLSMIPASLLLRYPKLPDALAYRFVGRTLIIRDRVSNLIVDYARQIAPPPEQAQR